MFQTAWRSKFSNKFFPLLRGMLLKMKKNIRRVIKKKVASGKYFLHKLTALIIVNYTLLPLAWVGKESPWIKGLLGAGVQNIFRNLPTPAQVAS